MTKKRSASVRGKRNTNEVKVKTGCWGSVKKNSSVIDVFQKGGKVLFDVGDSPRSIFVRVTQKQSPEL